MRASLDAAAQEIVLHTEYRERDLVKQVPGAKWKPKEGAWRAPLSWGVAWAIHGIFGTDATIDPALSTWARDMREQKINWLEWVRTAADLQPPASMSEALSATWDRLAPLQRVGTGFLAASRNALLADEMGSGKTVQTIVALRTLAERSQDVTPILVVCPNSMKLTWADEFGVWWPDLRVSVATGSAGNRRKAIAEVADGGAEVLVINWESLRLHTRLASYGSIALKRCPDCGGPTETPVTPASCEAHDKELNTDIQFTTIIADEAHRAKEPQSKQARALWQVGKLPTVTTRIALTGTPMEKSPDQLWSQLHFVSPADWPRKTDFIDRYCEKAWSPYGLDIKGLNPINQDEFFQVLEPMYLRRPKAAILPYLPEKVRQIRWVELGAKQRKAYDSLRKDYLAMLDDGELLSVFNSLSLHTRLSQLASAWATVDTFVDEEGILRQKVDLALPSAKADAFLEFVEEAAGSPIVAFAESRKLIEVVSKKLEAAKVPHGLITGAQNEYERHEAKAQFQEGRLPVLLLTFGAGSEGLTLTAAPTVAFIQRAWSSIQNQQAEDRVHRPGAEIHDHINIVDFVSKDTIDERRLEILDEKGDTAQEVYRDAEFLRSLLAR